MRLSLGEVSRYLGQEGKVLPREIARLAEACEAQLLARAKPRRLGRRMDKRELPFESADLDRHLEDCEEVYLTALTLGSEADRLLRLWSVESMAKATVGQAVAAVYLDECCDGYAKTLCESLPEGFGLLPGFSPGYGDFDLFWQDRFLTLLDAPRRLGLSLTVGGMLVPEKSVTAVLGISPNPKRHCISRCHLCQMTQCPFRKGS